MTENPLPSSQTVQPAAPDGVQQAINRQPAGVESPPSEHRPEPGPDLLERLQSFGLYVGALAAVWAVAFVVLWGVLAFRWQEAVGFGVVAVIVASFFIRSLIPQLAEKPKTSPVNAPPGTATATHPTDSFREIIETIVFVVVLVLLLKSFTAEAFVIPTGSMAETLWGYQKEVTCPQCGLLFPVNCSNEVDPSDDPGTGLPQRPSRIIHCTCPNCRQEVTLRQPQDPRRQEDPGEIEDPGWRSGDRVLVAKFVYDLFKKDPDRLDVVVFKFPGDSSFPHSGPVKRQVPINYIKRLIGLPEETIAIYRGKIWVLPKGKGPDYKDAGAREPVPASLLWQPENTYHNNDEAVKLFREGKYSIIRKKPENLLSMRRLVYDNEHQAKDLTDEKYRRWVPAPASGWSSKDQKAFTNTGENADPAWLRYRHVLRRGMGEKAQLITDFMGYNTGNVEARSSGENWASDLLLECQVQVEKSQGQFLMELSRGPDRFQAVFDLPARTCSVQRIHKDGNAEVLASAPTTLGPKGSYHVRFANVDDRLTVWVDEKLLFGPGVEYPAVIELAPTRENDLERPASIGSRGAAVTVSRIRLDRDTYYTAQISDSRDDPSFQADKPDTWAQLPSNLRPSTYYVQAEHYLCLGDNSPASSDGRSWGLVPQRLLLGRAMLVYYPFTRTGRIR